MDTVTITQEMVEAGMSKNGALSFKQINLLGVGKYSGWRRRAVGKQIVVENYQEFLELKDAHLKNGKRHKKGKTSVLLDKTITFILDNFTEEGDKFVCPHDCLTENCSDCDVLQDFNEIMGITATKQA